MSEQDSAIAIKPGPGRPPGSVPVDLAEVERLASMGMNQAQIAEGIGISQAKWFKDKANNTDFVEAYKRGQHECRIKVLTALETHAAKNFAVPMFMSKQQHILGFSDQAIDHNHKGKVELVVRHEIIDTTPTPALDITPTQEAIGVEEED